MDAFVQALDLVFDPYVLGVMLAAAAFGLLVGSIPGLTASMATALLMRPWLIQMKSLAMKPRILAGDLQMTSIGPRHLENFVDAFDKTHLHLEAMGAKIAAQKSLVFSSENRAKIRTGRSMAEHLHLTETTDPLPNSALSRPIDSVIAFMLGMLETAASRSVGACVNKDIIAWAVDPQPVSFLSPRKVPVDGLQPQLLGGLVLAPHTLRRRALRTRGSKVSHS